MKIPAWLHHPSLARPFAWLFALIFVCGFTLTAAAASIGGGTLESPADGPPPSYGLGGPGAVLVKNWDFGQGGTITNYDDLSANFVYRDQFNTITNKYGAKIVAPNAATAISGQPIEGVNCPTIREFTSDSLKTYLHALDGATTVNPVTAKAGSGSFMAKWTLPAGGSLLGQDIVWETRVRMVTPKYFWFALWTAGNAWNAGAEHDLVESFGYDNGGGFTNFDGRYWHSGSVSGSDVYAYDNWQASMAEAGVSSFDATEYHTWTWVYRADNSYAMYMDGILVQRGVTPYFWTLRAQETGVPINMYFLFDGSWGHTEVQSVNRSLDASELAGKYYEFDYSRVYLVPLTTVPDQPAGVSLEASHQEVVVKWSLTSRATAYSIYRATDPDGEWTRIASGIKQVEYTDQGLANGTTYHYRVTGSNAVGESPASGTLSATPHLTYTVDDADPACTYVGDWGISVSAPGFYKVGYHHDRNTGAVGGKRATFATTLVNSGWYNVYLRAPSSTTRASNTPVDISHQGGVATEVVNQRINNNQWTLLGRYPMSAGPATVVLRNDGTNGNVIADAVRWVPDEIAAPVSAPPAPGGLTVSAGDRLVLLSWSASSNAQAEASRYEVRRSTMAGDPSPTVIAIVTDALSFTDTTVGNGTVYYYTVVGENSVGRSPPSLEVGAAPDGGAEQIVDDADPNVTYTGTWTTSSKTPGSYLNSYHAAALGDGKHATYTLPIAVTASYEILMRWPSETTRASNAKVDIHHAGATEPTVLTLNQRTPNNTWYSLGSYTFQAGTDARLTLRNDGANGPVVADAVKWVRTIPAATVTLLGLSHAYDGQPKQAQSTTVPEGLSVWYTYDGTTTPPVEAGAYAVVARIGDPGYTGTSAGTLVITQATQTIAFPNPGPKPVSAEPFALTGTSSSGLPLHYEVVGGPATLQGETVTLTGAGTVTLRASQSGNRNYMPAEPVTLSFIVGETAQTIQLTSPGDKVFGDADFTVYASASSGLPVALTVVEGSVSIAGHTVSILGAGAVRIRASQAGNDQYRPAPDVEVAFTVRPAAASIALVDVEQVYDGSPKPAVVQTTPDGLEVVLTYSGGSGAPSFPGVYPVTARINHANYQGSAEGVVRIRATAAVRRAPDIDGDVFGSVQLLAADTLKLTGNAGITGDLLMPGTPALSVHGNPTFGGVRDATGAVGPTHHQVSLRGNALLRFLVRRVDPAAVPTVSAPAAPTGTREVHLRNPNDNVGSFATVRDLTVHRNVGVVNVPAGAYGDFTAKAGGFRLGVEGASEPSVYGFTQLSLEDKAVLQVVGPVILRIGKSLKLEGTAGSAEDPDLLQVEMVDGRLDLEDKAVLHARVIAPNGKVSIGRKATLRGHVMSDRLEIRAGGELVEGTEE